MTTGEQLKKDLGLNKFKSIKISRCLDTALPTYLVVVDSKGFPITTQRVFSDPYKFAIYLGKNPGKFSKFVPLMDIETFNADLRGRVFVKIDLAGSNLINKSMYESKDQFLVYDTYIAGNIFSLLEGSGFNIADLKQNAVSDITKKHFKIRHSDIGQQGVTLESLVWDETEDSMLLQFFVIPTFKQDIKTYTFSGQPKKDNHYEVEVLFEEVKKFLGEKSEFLELPNSVQIEKIREMIKKGEVKIHANDPSFFFQGGFERADELGYSIYDFKGPKGRNIWADKHSKGTQGIYITKHTLEVLQVVPTIAEEITQMIRER